MFWLIAGVIVYSVIQIYREAHWGSRKNEAEEYLVNNGLMEKEEAD